MIKCLIFDFDGVILDSVNIKTLIFKEMYSHYGTGIANKVEDYHLKNGGMSRFKKFKYFEEVILKKKCSNKKINFLSKEFESKVKHKVIKASYIKGAKRFLNTNYKKYKFFISTGTPQKEIVEILKEKKIKHLFKGIYGSPESKKNHIKKIIKKYSFKKEDILFLGDSRNDYEAALDQNINFIAVGNNYFFKEKEIDKLVDLSQLNRYLEILK